MVHGFTVFYKRLPDHYSLYSVCNLTAGVVYEAQARAENVFGADGRGEFSDSAVIFAKPPAPVFVSLAPVYSASPFGLRATFRAPDVAGGGEVTAVVRWRAPRGAWQPDTGYMEITRGTSEVRITPGALGVQYEVQFASRNGYGLGAWGESKFTTLLAEAPAAAAVPDGMTGLVSANAYGGANIEVTWSPPADNRARISHYDVRWRLNSAAAFAAGDTIAVANDGRNAHVIRAIALVADAYNVQVRARNRIGDGAFGSAVHGGSEIITTGGGPDASQGIAPDVSLVPGDARLTLNWTLPQYADDTVKDYGVTYEAYRVRWSRRTGEGVVGYLNAAGAAGEEVAISDAASAAVRAYDISGLINGEKYKVESWLQTNRDQAALSAHLAASGSEFATRRIAAGLPLAQIGTEFGTPRAPDVVRPAPVLNALALGAPAQDNAGEAGAGRFVTLDASWAAPGDVVRAYQLRWRPVSADASGQKRWQAVDLAAAQLAYNIREYVRDNPGMPGLREIEYEAQLLARFAEGADSAWSASQRITPPDPRLRGMRVTAAPGFRQIAGPLFAPGVFAYAFKIPHAASGVHLTPQAAAGRSITLSINGGDAQPLAPNARSAAIAPGEPGERTTVEVRVSATTDAASSSATYAYALTRDAAPAVRAQEPGAPSNVRIASGPDNLWLSWGAPAISGGDSNYIDYRVRWRTAGTAASGRTPGKARGDWESGADGSRAGRVREYNIGGLAQGVMYETQVRAVSGRGGVGLWSEYQQGSPVAFTLDVNASGGAADGTDGIMISRYVLGLRDEAVTRDLDVPTGTTIAQVIASIESGFRSERFDVDGNGVTTAADGIMIARYLLGVTGPALTEGQSHTSPAKVEAAMEALRL